jgi:SOS response regulatory protein OraA/RecX
MTVKLNLSVDEEVAKEIKRYARRNNTSVSRIAEELFTQQISKENREQKSLNFFTKTCGIADTKVRDDVKDTLTKAIAEKHG